MDTTPKTLTQAIRHYADPQTCINAVALMRWEDGSPVCPHCNATQETRNHYWLAKQKRWKCYACRKQFSVKVGTIFEDSPLGLDIWLIALWMLCNCRNGVSSYTGRLFVTDLASTSDSAISHQLTRGSPLWDGLEIVPVSAERVSVSREARIPVFKSQH